MTSSSPQGRDPLHAPGSDLSAHGTVSETSATEEFPSIDDHDVSGLSPGSTPSKNRTDSNTGHSGPSRPTSTSTLTSRLRGASKKFEESSIPVGFMDATGQIAASLPTISNIRRGSYNSDGWSAEGQLMEQRRLSLGQRNGSQTSQTRSDTQQSVPTSPIASKGFPSGSRHQSVNETIPENDSRVLVTAPPVITSHQEENQADNTTKEGSDVTCTDGQAKEDRSSSHTNITPYDKPPERSAAYRTDPFDNGYQFPPKHNWTQSTAIGAKAFWKFCLTPFGFLVVLYGLNVVAWGGMIFLLLCNASPAMCYPSCNDINSPRRIWIEYDSQILTALFCVTGFGLIPWRFRDLYYLLQFRLQKKEIGLRRLAGIHRGWFRVQGSQDLPISLGPSNIALEHTKYPDVYFPFPLERIPDPPLTGIRAPPTALWRLDYVIWMNCWNTFLQAVLSGLMWGMNRYNRPSWSTGVFVAFACIAAALGGIMMFTEGKKVKGIEGITVSAEDIAKLREDREAGIIHFNNIKDQEPKEKKEKKEKKGLFHKSPKIEKDVELREHFMESTPA